MSFDKRLASWPASANGRSTICEDLVIVEHDESESFTAWLGSGVFAGWPRLLQARRAAQET